ncbi:MAG: GTPase Era [Solirubrobacteraceae bacterium]
MGEPASEHRCPGGMTRAGFVALAGRPNVGKSTLLNAVVGERVAIVSDRAQTTRRAIRGVRTDGECQLVLVDLPGVQRPRDALTARMARRVREELAGADAALLVLSGEQGVGPGDRFIAHALGGLVPAHLELTDPHTLAPPATAIHPLSPAATAIHTLTPPATAIAVNKVDRLSRAGTLEALRGAAELGLEGEVFPISARTGEGVGELVAHLAALMPEGPFLFAPEQRSDQPLQLLAAELIREAAIRRTFQELPHAVEVVVEDLERVRADLTRVRALIWVESASQKGIVIGAQGRMIRAIGSAARRELQRELGCRVHLDLSVRVRRDWRGDESLLDRLGIT